MNNEEQSMASADEDEPRTDALNPAIAAALVQRVLPPLPEDVDADAALTAADRQALAALGSSEEFVNRVIASVAPVESTVPRPSEEDTLYADADITVPLPEVPYYPESVSLGLDGLMARLEAVQNAEQIRWTSCYRKRQELGRGGQGVVYLTECLDELSGEQALKIYSPEPYSSAAAYREDMKRLLAVASQVHRIHHDNLIGVHRFIDYQGIYVMVMQWIDGFDLRRLLDRQILEKLRDCVDPERWAFLNRVIYATLGTERQYLQPLLAVDVVEKCLRGLSALHAKGIVHGDIKPSNIMLDCNGSIRLIDIGSACSSHVALRQRIWTPRYAPPEFLERGEWTPKSDLASLGYVLVELLSGRSDIFGPQQIGDASTRTGDPHRDEILLEAKRCLPQRLPEILPERVRGSEKLIGLCRKLIDPNPEHRFADANQAIDGDGDGDGTWHFRRQLISGNLAVHEATEIMRWIEDVKKGVLQGIITP